MSPKHRREIPPVVVKLLPVPPRMLRIYEAAAYIGATNWFLEELIRDKKLPYLVLGKRRVVDVKDLDDWINRQKRDL